MSAHFASTLSCALLLVFCSIARAGAEAPSLRLSERLGTPNVASAEATDTAAPVELKLATSIRDSLIHRLVLLQGQAMVGANYAFGRNSVREVDCSALVQRIFGSAGVKLPRTSREMAKLGQPVDQRQLAAGDLMFYRWKRNALHVAIYLDDGRILHASPRAGEVVVTQLNDAWNRRLVGARRVI
jgi:cell wall-associated NlpC family hydrolase